MAKKHWFAHLALGIGAIAGALGLLAIIAAWLATWKGAFLGLGAGHWYEDAKALLFLGVFCFIFVQVSVMHGWSCPSCRGDKGCCGEKKCQGCGADCEHCTGPNT